jgi:hypothetical protein
LPPAWAIFAVAGARGTRAAGLLPRALCAALPVASVLVTWPTFVDSDRIYTDLTALMPRMQPGSAVMALNVEQPDHRMWGPMVVMGHVVAIHGGRSFYDYSLSPVSPVSQYPDKQWAEPISRMQNLPYEMRPDWDFTRFRYLVLSCPKPTTAAALTLAIRDDAVLIGNHGDLYLFESRLPLVAIDADDAQLPRPHPPTLRKKLAGAVEELKEIDLGAQASASP